MNVCIWQYIYIQCQKQTWATLLGSRLVPIFCALLLDKVIIVKTQHRTYFPLLHWCFISCILLPSTSLNCNQRAPLVAPWLRIRLPTQGTWLQAQVRECRVATKPVCHIYWACALQPASHNCWARMPQLLKPTHLEPVLCNKRSHCNEKPVHHNKERPPPSPQLEKACTQQRRPNAAKNK